MDAAATQRWQQGIDRWFRRHGTPALAKDYRAGTDIFTRAMPVFGLVLLVEVLNALNDRFTTLQNVLAFLGGAALLVGGYVVVNLLRRRPPFTAPDDIGVPELAFFVLAPPVLPLVFGGQVRDALLTLLVNLLVVLAVWAVIGAGLIPMVAWAVRRAWADLNDLSGLLLRSMPLMLLFSAFLFLTAELWQVADGFATGQFVVVMVAFVLLAAVFIAVRTPRQIDELSSFGSWAAVWDEVDGTSAPVGSVTRDGWPQPPVSPRPRRPERVNLLLVFLVSQGVPILFASLGAFVVFFLFGLLAVPEAVLVQWVGRSPEALDVYARFRLLGGEVVVTNELVRVSLFLAGLAGLQLTVQSVTDPRYRDDVLADVFAEVRQILAVRTVYRAVLDGPTRPSAARVAPPR